jgi:tetratricopeptide (TPR) repeat protein
VACQGLLHERQRTLHARITEAIERLSTERVTEQAERLAHHALRGELWEKAVAYLRQAGLRAMARAAYHEAIAHLEQALGNLRRLPESRETAELAIDIRIDLRNALQPLYNPAGTGALLHEAEALARTLGDQHRLARIATFMVIQCLITGDFGEAVRFGQEALSMARALGDRSNEVAATSFLGMTHAARGQFSDAATLLERNAALEGDLRYERFGAPAIQSALSGAWLADVLSELGARASEAHALCLAGDVASTGGAEDAEGYYRKALALAGELGMRPLVAHCHLGLGKLHGQIGKRPEARKHFTTATTMYRELNMPFWLEQAQAEMTALT